MTLYPTRVRQVFEADQRGNPICTLALYETATSQREWGCYNLRGGIDPGNLRLYSLVVEVAEVWMMFLSGDETASPLGPAGPRRWPEGQLFPRSGSMRKQSTCGVGVSTPCGADSTRRISVSAPRC